MVAAASSSEVRDHRHAGRNFNPGVGNSSPSGGAQKIGVETCVIWALNSSVSRTFRAAAPQDTDAGNDDYDYHDRRAAAAGAGAGAGGLRCRRRSTGALSSRRFPRLVAVARSGLRVGHCSPLAAPCCEEEDAGGEDEEGVGQSDAGMCSPRVTTRTPPRRSANVRTASQRGCKGHEEEEEAEAEAEEAEEAPRARPEVSTYTQFAAWHDTLLSSASALAAAAAATAAEASLLLLASPPTKTGRKRHMSVSSSSSAAARAFRRRDAFIIRVPLDNLNAGSEEAEAEAVEAGR